ncbi:hypothetical protein DL93DRAFT_2168976 [Clavulina sp. PMI_390]|nr:hypothetical protein DL93DRAFT_2168976 [Clavulina sp. PMI_390]
MKFEADRFLWRRLQLWHDDWPGTFPPFLHSERALHVKEIIITLLGDPPDGGLIAAFQFRKTMEHMVNVARNLESLSVFVEVDHPNSSTPAISKFGSGVLNDLIDHPCPKLLALELQVIGPGGMLLHPRDMEVLYNNHPLLESLTLNIPLSENVINQTLVTPGFPHLKELEVSNLAQFHLGKGCRLKRIKLKLQAFMVATEMMFAEVETFSQSLVGFSLHWEVDSFSNSPLRFDKLINRAFGISLPMLEVLSFRCSISGFDLNGYFNIDKEAEGILCAALLKVRQFGLRPRLRSLKFAQFSVENIELSTQALFRDAPTSLKYIEVLFPPKWASSTSPVKLGERHMVNKRIGEAGCPIFLHTLIPSGDGQDPAIYIARRQTITHE